MNKVDIKDNEKILKLTLKREWFDMILSGEKTEEYREIKKYWIRRFCGDHLEYADCLNGVNCEECWRNDYPTYKHYDVVLFTNGYNSKSPQMFVEILCITEGESKPEWGGDGKNCFIIKLGKVLSTKNIK